MKEFFVDLLSIKADVDDELYARRWLKLQQEDAPDPQRVEAALERIFPVLRRVAQNADEAPPWWREFLAEARVWTQDNCFVSPAKAFIPDDGELKKLLSKEGARFVWRPNKDSFDEYRVLYQALRVRLLTEELRCQLANVGEAVETAPGEERYLPIAVKRTICFYFWARNKEEFRRLKVDGVLPALLNAREMRVENLELHYQLDGVRAIDADAVAYFDRERRKLYLSATAPDPELDVEVSLQLARVLSQGRPSEELNSFIASILGKTEQHLDYLIERKGWHLPLEERKWMEQAIAGQPEPFQPTLEADSDAATGELAPLATQPESVTSHEGGLETVQTPASLAAPEAPAPRVDEAEESEDVSPVKPQVSLASSWEARRPQEQHDGRAARDGDGSWRTRALEEMTGSAGPGDATSGRAAAWPSLSPEKPERLSGDGEPRERRSTYAEPEGASERQAPRIDSEKQRAIADAGIAAVMDYEWKHNRKPVRLDDNHPGWDINSFSLSYQPDDAPDRRIEVKSMESAWDDWGIALTPTEHDAARQYRETYYLYVVEHALDAERRRIYVFHNPFAKTTEYRFRHNWRACADETG